MATGTFARCKGCGEMVELGDEHACAGFAAEAAKQRAIDRVEKHADAEWMATVEDLILCLEPGEEFTVDRVWNHLDRLQVSTHEPRALGAVMRRMVKAGKITNTGRYRASKRSECHGRPVPVWVRI